MIVIVAVIVVIIAVFAIMWFMCKSTLAACLLVVGITIALADDEKKEEAVEA